MYIFIHHTNTMCCFILFSSGSNTMKFFSINTLVFIISLTMYKHGTVFVQYI